MATGSIPVSAIKRPRRSPSAARKPRALKEMAEAVSASRRSFGIGFASDLPQTDGLIMRGRPLKAWLHNAVTMTRDNGYSLGFTWNFKLEAKYRAERLAQRCGH